MPSPLHQSAQYPIVVDIHMLENQFTIDKNYEYIKNETIKGLDAKALIYKTTDKNKIPELFYLIKVSDGILGISFHDFENFDNSFITEFLNKIRSFEKWNLSL